MLIGEGEFGTWVAIIPEENGETIAVRHTVHDLLSRLDTLLGNG